MLSVRLICVGKLGEKFWKTACEEYSKRLSAYCKLEMIELPEQRLPDAPSEGQIQQALAKEAALIRAKIPAGAAVIALCVEGQMLSSEALAETLGAFDVENDVSAPFGARYGPGTAVSFAEYPGGREIP